MGMYRFMLQTRNGKRTAKASVKIAVDMVKEGLLTEEEGLLQINAERMDFFLFPSIDPKSPKNVIARGLPASPGTRTGMIVFCPDVRYMLLLVHMYCLALFFTIFFQTFTFVIFWH
jgi:phosphoenolpyruvate synthase/pyruvate phosphate dikinase